ncbi:MAG TPA: lipocalin-like domain-containing protein [Xanthobacteraceae bacterium]|nr:lipocalin-like domain-containing protein [Xanthobacteraceae bacterium]
MTHLFVSAAAAMSLLAFGVAMPASPASAQADKNLVGAWTIVSITIEQGDKKSEPYGPNVKGTQVFDANGRFAVVVMRGDLPKVASNNRETATPEESQQIARGSLAYFGSYTTNETDKSMTLQIESATLANWNGTTQKRLYVITGDQMTLTNPTTSAGSGVAKVVLKRAGNKTM